MINISISIDLHIYNQILRYKFHIYVPKISTEIYNTITIILLIVCCTKSHNIYHYRVYQGISGYIRIHSLDNSHKLITEKP